MISDRPGGGPYNRRSQENAIVPSPSAGRARLPRLASAAAGALAAAAFVVSASAELGFSRSVSPRLVAHMERAHGAGARARLEGWKAFVADAAKRDERSLAPVNRFFNVVPGVDDFVLWHVEDYWATPAEMLSVNGADCEDYAFAKYFTLKELGVPVNRLRLVYATTARSNVAHMVLAYYEQPGGEPLILDNLDAQIRRASERPDLVPVYTFNDDDLVLTRPGQAAVRASPTASRKWREYLEKLTRERAL